MGVWDAEASCWSDATEAIQDLAWDAGHVTFSTTALRPFAAIRSRVALMPYRAWRVCPSDVAASSTDVRAVTVFLSIGPADTPPLALELRAVKARLRGPAPAALASVTDTWLDPLGLLCSLRRLGWNLMPEGRDADLAHASLKDDAVERAMCDDVAQLAGSHLLASSTWNGGQIEVRQ